MEERIANLASETAVVDEEVWIRCWKGLFYDLWMCDGPIYQQRLAERQAKLFKTVPAIQIPQFTSAYWRIMQHEWPTLDRYRLDKFYLQIRRVLENIFMQIYSMAWPLGISKQVSQCLAEIPLKGFKNAAPGIRLHVLDIYSECLVSAGVDLDEIDATSPGYALVTYPVIQLAKDGDSPQIRKEAKELLRILKCTSVSQ